MSGEAGWCNVCPVWCVCTCLPSPSSRPALPACPAQVRHWFCRRAHSSLQPSRKPELHARQTIGPRARLPRRGAAGGARSLARWGGQAERTDREPGCLYWHNQHRYLWGSIRCLTLTRISYSHSHATLQWPRFSKLTHLTTLRDFCTRSTR